MNQPGFLNKLNKLLFKNPGWFMFPPTLQSLFTSYPIGTNDACLSGI